MLKLAKNFADGKNLKASYGKLIKMLEAVRMRKEECFTIECLCRVLKTKKERQLMLEKITEINAIGSNSYNSFRIKISPISHEFPLEIKNPCESAVIFDMDRYMALMHIIALLKKSEIKESKKILDIASKIEKEFKFKTIACQNSALVEHAMNVMSAGELLAGTNLKDYDDIEILLEAINFGYREEDVYLKILKMYKDMDKLKDAMNFYNESYAPLFNKEFYTKINKFEKFLTEELFLIQFN